jgi:hypothetical protein
MKSILQVNTAVIETADPGYLLKSQQIVEDGNRAGVYISKTEGIASPNLHYGIVIDCGSSGSRLYIYIWPDHSGKRHELLQIRQLLDEKGQPVVKKLEPGSNRCRTLLLIAFHSCY